MSVNHTLGNFALQDLPKRRASCTSLREVELRDPFEDDPFKVQSYNFRYADPPGYSPHTPFGWQELLHRNTEMPQSDFRNTRRRRFVQTNNYNANNIMHSNYTSSATSYYPSAYNFVDTAPPTMDSGYASHVSAYDSHYRIAPQTPTRQPFLRGQRSSGSLCEIQIKINRSEHCLPPENVIISISADKNSNIITTPYHSEGVTINTVPLNCNNSATAKQSYTSARAAARCQSKERMRCSSTSSDSSCDFEPPKKSLERVPQFIALKNLDNKVQGEKQASVKREQKLNTIPFVTPPPPWVLGAKSARSNSNNNLETRNSNQTIMNNLDSRDAISVKSYLLRKSSNVSLSTSSASSKPSNSQAPLKRSASSMNKDSTVKVNANKPRSSSSVRNLQKPKDKDPLRVNINLYSKNKRVSRV